MNDQHLMRYARHILLNEFGIEAQEKIVNAHALIIGAGGLGSPAAFYLASSGVGTLTLVDDDVVELSNLQRQILHTTDRVGMLKAVSAKHSLQQLNPTITVHPITERLDEHSLAPLVEAATIVLDCTDNFATRHAINRVCVAKAKPLVSGAGIQFAGQVSTYDLRDPQAPCYNCLFPEADDVEELRCATTGVFAPVVGVIGCMQAAEALKVLGGFGEALNGRLLSFDALESNWHTVRFRKDPGCTVCQAV
ncbi:MAG TPA: HesA/MoeB/ThiF family protein [Paenalcaligenes sp.]|nr:HesA/MoeB/ThiF family protein [Paenalcaligenes sp.]